jgi:general secretion pathway protein E
VFARLLQIGVEPFQLASSVTAVLAQRLPRRCCDACGGSGCEACSRTGYAGRVLVSELLSVGEATRAAVMARAPLAELADAAARDGMTPLADTAGKLVDAGVTTEDELHRVGVG